ncbi:hypothetical protein FB451DRAFT_1396236 [Mycena latifolia]|nr:hypothetical protein FB451DRAFT_1396236 [Mycena latifolia]
MVELEPKSRYGRETVWRIRHLQLARLSSERSPRFGLWSIRICKRMRNILPALPSEAAHADYFTVLTSALPRARMPRSFLPLLPSIPLVIIATTGMHGEPPDSQVLGGTRVVQITFVIFDNADGTVKMKGPYGTKFAKPFNVTANGNSSRLVDMRSILNKPTGGLFGLTFYDVEYRAV